MNGPSDSAAAPKRFFDGSHRSCDPAETIERVEPLFARCGITRIANLTGLDRLQIPVVAVYRPNARSIAVSQGKGLTLDAAKASGVMEAIEVWHAEQGALPLRRATARDKRDRFAICDLDRLPQAAGFRGDEHGTPRLWAEGHNLLDNMPLWCPLEIVDADYTRSGDDADSRFLRSTNGLASGNHWLEAVCHGIGELVERDATSVWRARARRTGRLDGRIDPSSVDDADCRHLLSRYATAGIDVAIWELSSDVGLAAFFVLIMDQHDATDLLPARPANGKGCHSNKAIALSRALTEAAQTRLTYISGARDDLSETDYEAASQQENTRQCRALIDGWPDERRQDFCRVSHHDSDDFSDDLERMLRGLKGIGIDQVIAIDLAPDTPEVDVVRVVIPGLEGPDEHPAYLPGSRAGNA